MSNSKIDILSINETKLDSTIKDSEVYLGTGHYLVGGGGEREGEGGRRATIEEKTLAKKLWPSLLKDPKNSDPPLAPFKKIVTLPKDKIVKQLFANITQSLFWQSNFNNTDKLLSMSCMFYQIWLYTGCHLFVLPHHKHLFRHHYLRR